MRLHSDCNTNTNSGQLVLLGCSNPQVKVAFEPSQRTIACQLGVDVCHTDFDDVRILNTPLDKKLLK